MQNEVRIARKLIYCLCLDISGAAVSAHTDVFARQTK